MNKDVYLLQCYHCGETIKAQYMYENEIAICVHCATLGLPNPMNLLSKAAIKASDAGTKLRAQMDKEYIDNILAKKEYDSKAWYQKFAVYTKRIINILRT